MEVTRGGREGDRRQEGGMEQGDGGEGGNKEGREGERVGERARGGREEPMMLGRQRASVEEGRVEGGRVDEGNERGRHGTWHGRRE